MISPEAQALTAALFDALNMQLTPSSTVTLHVDPEGQLAMAEFTTRVRKQKALAAVRTPAHTQPQTQQLVGRRSAMR